jgi:hypothetical protein
MRVHVDAKICEAAGSAMMKWNGNGDEETGLE